MFFELFVFLTLMAVALVAVATFSRKFWPLLISGPFFTLTGAALLSEGIRYETGGTFVTAVDYVITTAALTASDSIAVSMIANTFLYGGILVLVAGLILLFRPGETKLGM